MERLAKWWRDVFQVEPGDQQWWEQKKALCEKRGVEISRIQGSGHVYRELRYDQQSMIHYQLHLSYLMKQNDFFYREEQVIPMQVQIHPDQSMEHVKSESSQLLDEKEATWHPDWDERDPDSYNFTYDRLEAVKYAERWWNDYNPKFEKFNVDCTNYVSQCLLAGGAPMRGSPDRAKGWWYQDANDNWSYSWSVSHALRWYLSGSTKGLKGKEVEAAEELAPGDVICYDCEGDGKWDHTTIVVAKDANDMPLVNAHTENSRNRYWSYEDSTAWTPNIAYKFFHIDE